MDVSDELSVLESYRVIVVRPKAQLAVKVVGGFGKVCEAYCNGAPCVAKGLRSVLMETPSEAVSGKASLFTQLLKECVLHSKLRHPNVIQFIGVEYGNDRNKYDLLLVTERIEMELSSCLQAYRNISLAIKLSVLRDVSAGLLYLHSFNPPIIHGDITTTNILLTPDWRAKIADFGNQSLSAVRISPDALPYMPPEVLTKSQKYDSKLDIFSFGIVALYVAIQTSDTDRSKRAEQIRSLESASELQCLYKIVISCCDKDPGNRPTSCELNDHLQTLCVELQVSYSSIPKLEETSALHQALGTLENDKARAEAKVIEVQRELEDVKKGKNQEMKQLKAEIEDLKSKLDHEMAQSVSYKLDFEREREDRTRAVQIIDDLKKGRGASESTHGTFLLKQLETKEQQLKECHHKIQEMDGELHFYKTATETLKEAIKNYSQDKSPDIEKISSLEEELRVVKTENDTLRNEVDVFKTLLIKFADVSANLSETQVTIAKAGSVNRALKEKTEVLENEKRMLEDKYAGEITDLKAQLHSVKENLDAMEILMHRELKDLNAQLSEAKEEIAVKVAQVKQYQKQVEAYKQQAHTSSQSIPSSAHQLSSESSAQPHATPPNLAAQMVAVQNPCETSHSAPLSDHPAPVTTVNLMMSTNDVISSVCSTEGARVAKSHDPSRCDPVGGNDDDLPPPIFPNTLYSRSPSLLDAAQKNSHHQNMEASRPSHTPLQSQIQSPHYERVASVPRGVRDDVLSGMRSSNSDQNDCNHRSQHAQWADDMPLPSDHNAALGTPAPFNPYSLKTQKSTDLAEGIDSDISAMVQGGMDVVVSSECVPLDPNLKCPVCGTVFRKGEIQKFKCHVETCAK